jgi:hypothetical protein
MFLFRYALDCPLCQSIVSAMRTAFLVVVLLSLAVNGVSHVPRNTAKSDETKKHEQSTANPPSQTIAIYDQPRSKDDADAANQHQQEIEIQRQLSKFTGWLVAVGFLQFVVLAVQAVLFFQQRNIMEQHEEWMQKHDANLTNIAQAAKKNSEIAEMAVKLSERADVLVQSAALDPGQTISGGDSRVVIRYKNFGNTRATNSALSMNLLIEGVPATNSGRIPPITMGAGDEQTISSERFIAFLNLETAKKVLSGQTALRFETQALYQDVFGGAHRTFCAGTFDARTRGFEINKQETD